MIKLLAADIPLLPPGKSFEGFGPLGTVTQANAPTLFATALSAVIGVMTIIAFIWFTFQFLIGGIRILGSGGDKAGLEAAKKQITSGIIGLVIVIAATFIVSLFGYILGIPSPLNPRNLINAILAGFNNAK